MNDNDGNIKTYEGYVLKRNGPKTGVVSEISYDILAYCYQDGSVIQWSAVKPTMRPAMNEPGQPEPVIWAADPYDDVKVKIVDGQPRIVIQEALYIGECGTGG